INCSRTANLMMEREFPHRISLQLKIYPHDFRKNWCFRLIRVFEVDRPFDGWEFQILDSFTTNLQGSLRIGPGNGVSHPAGIECSPVSLDRPVAQQFTGVLTAILK